ncbi:hypothetical protein ACJRO7_026656 [Eucalyptus globulus]|uniref:AAA+ ATPase domain-containing protein n=1 Tax=Eucalyptus globulus TaxID=34317 RepID=A0ABD3JUV7_EUCGL
MADIGVPVAVEVAKCLVAPVGRHCSYVIFCDRYVRQLNVEVKKLDDTKDEVQHSIDEARNNMKPIKGEVERWVNEVGSVPNMVRDVLYYDTEAKKTCFYGWLPNPKARYHLGKKASRTVKDIQALIAGGRFQKVDFENPPPGLVGGASDVNSSAGDGGNTMLKSQASTFQDVMKALYDERHKVIGVYGPGGVGKTFLLERVKEELDKEGKEGRPFHMIVKSKVSQTPDLTNIQYDIAYALDLKDVKAEPSDEGRRDLLFKRLQKDPSKKVLIILDDLWAELDLKAVGIPMGNEKCKLLLTSRDKRVLEQRMHADQTFPLKNLEKEEALELFEKIVGDGLSEDLKEKAAQVVTKLAGLPLLIDSVASTLKSSDVSKWEDMLIKIEHPHEERIVKWSYDHLESEEAKCLFLLCGLIGGTIRVELLLELGMGLGLFRRFDNKMQSSRNRLNTMLNSLRSFCLLQDGGEGKENVTIHDVYSEAIVSDAFSGQNSLMINNNYDSWPKEKLEKCWACLVNAGSDRLVELMLLRFPHVKILMLSEQYDRGDCSRMDFTYMEELRVLYLGSMRITSLPSSMEILRNLQSLSINCHVEDVANLGKLKALRILSFTRSTISRLPKEIGKLTNLRSLNLNHCYRLKIIEPGALKGLINLEELHMKKSLIQWMGKHEIPSESCGAGLVELKSLTKLASLEISISDPMILLKDGDLPFGNLIRFWINIGNAYGRGFRGLRTMKLQLGECDGILSKEWVQKTLQKTQYLYLDGLGEFKENAHELCIQGFTQLKHLDIHNSPSIKHIISSLNDFLTAFTDLESLFLENLINLEKICNGPITPDCFSKLKVVHIKKCHQLKNLQFLSEMQRHVHLKEIEIWECDSLQAIITDDAGKEEVVVDDMVELPNVRRLDLRKLPNMTSFCIRAEGAPIQVSLPCLESLVMVGLLGLEKILYSEPSIKYSGLKSLKIEESKSTLSIPKDWILKLPNLESMEIAGSPSTEIVFNLEELKVTREVEILSQLSTLALSKLPNLGRMSKQVVQLQGISMFRNLKKLSVCETGLSFLFSMSVAKCLREIRDIKVENCPNMKTVIMDEEGTDGIIELPLLKQLSITCCPIEKFFSYPHGKKESVTTTSDSQDAYFDSFFDQKVRFPNIRKLHIEGARCKELWNNQIPYDSFCKLEVLQLEHCDNLLCVAPSHMWKRLQLCLNFLKVRSCRMVKIIYKSDGTDTKSGKMTTLVLQDLENLRHIWQSDGFPNVPFPNLRYVEVVRCSCLEMLFTTFTAKFLGQIEELVVESCEDIKLIAGHEECEEAAGTTITFSKLTILRLFKLPKFRGILAEKYSMEFPSSQVFCIGSCGMAPDQGLDDWERYQNKWFDSMKWCFEV